MKRFSCIIIFILSLFFSTYGQNSEVLVKINTNCGAMVFKLYNQTPKHRDNFIKLVSENFYDSLLFHRVIKNFMIQAGDPNSKHAEAGVFLGQGDLGYTIDAEFVPALFHKKGVLAAAREGDDKNPMKKSSACQFYIVQGKTFSEEDLNKFEDYYNKILSKNYFDVYIHQAENMQKYEKLMRLSNTKNDSLKIYLKNLMAESKLAYNKLPPFKMSDEKRKIYSTQGGAPHLDGSYTVFGEIISGLDILEKISTSLTDENDRPKENIRIINMQIVKP